MMDRPLVSVIIPVYNVEKYLSQCVNSVINQTMISIEIILVDDGSTDSSGSMCDSFSRIDNRIRVIHKANGGLSDARNVGFDLAKGEYVYFLDSDDWIESYAIESLYSFAEENNLNMILFDSRVVDENGNDYLDIPHYMRYHRIGNYKGVFSGPELFGKMIEEKEYYSSVPLLFINRSKMAIRFETMLHEDELFTIKMLYSMDRVAYYPESLYVRRIRQGSIMTIGKTPNHYCGMAKVIEEILEINNIDNSILRYACTLLQCSEIIFRGLNHEGKKIVASKRQQLLKTIKSNGFYGYKRLIVVTNLLVFYPLYNKIVNKNNSIISRVIHRIQKIGEEKILVRKLSLKSPKIIIIGVPTHGNLGDHAIAIAQKNMFLELFPGIEVIEIDRSTYAHRKKVIRKKITLEDTIVIPGGGWLGNQWYHNELMVEQVCKSFKQNRLIILPQTVYFEKGKKTKNQINSAEKIFSYNHNFLFFVRDSNSFCFVSKFFKVHCNLVPDMALRMTNNNYNHTRSGVLVCFRNDCERVIGSNIKDNLLKWLEKEFNDIKQTTTVIGSVPVYEREVAVEKKLIEFSRAKLIITDRLHAMVFSAITGTPCLAFDNSSKKVSGVYEWIKHLNYVRIVTSFEEVKQYAKAYYIKNNNNYTPPCFSELEDAIRSFIG